MTVDELISDRRYVESKVELYPGSNLLVDSTKLVFCESSDWSTWTNRIVSVVFDVDEIYRHNVLGGKPKEKKGEQITEDDCKIKLDEFKLSEIYKSIQVKFPSFVEDHKEKNKWKSMVNSVLNLKLGAINRYFKQMRDNFGSENISNDYVLPRDDSSNLKSLSIYSNNPNLFKELDAKINEQLNFFSNIV